MTVERVCARDECSNITTNPQYCSRSCAVTVNNEKQPKRIRIPRVCFECSKEYNQVGKVGKSGFCSKACVDVVAIRQLLPLLIEDSPVTGQSIKQKLLRRGFLKNECYECGITEWRGKPAPLELDHINGKNRDHRLENLRILCANCHSQQPTHCWGNTGYVRSRAKDNAR